MFIRLNLTEFEAQLIYAALDRPDLAHIGDMVHNPKGDSNSGIIIERIRNKLRQAIGE